MTEEENKEFEEFLEWKAEKKRKEEENEAKQEEAERQVKVNAQMPQVEEKESMEFDNNQVPCSSYNKKNGSNNTGGKSSAFPLAFAFVLLIFLIIFLFCICVLKDCSDNNQTTSHQTTSYQTESTSNSEADKERLDSLAAINAAENKRQDSLKRARRIELLKNTIKIKKAYLSSPNSAGGVDAHLVWKNVSNKTIKYLNWSGYPINAVGDPVSCEARGTIEGGGKVTGPIKPGATYGYGTYWDCLWYNYSAKKLVLTDIYIEYMDGSSININKDELKYVR